MTCSKCGRTIQVDAVRVFSIRVQQMIHTVTGERPPSDDWTKFCWPECHDHAVSRGTAAAGQTRNVKPVA
jgi:hypothetical protein